MKEIKLQELIDKYPKIFVPYEGNPGGVNWTGVPKGWLPIIDDLCGAIQDYVDNSKTSKHNPKWVEGSEEPKFIVTRPQQPICLQMKEKFAGLRFYVSGADDVVEGMIAYAEYLCNDTCEVCHTRHNTGMINKGWIRIVCRDCAENEGKLDVWSERKKFVWDINSVENQSNQDQPQSTAQE